ncbi:MAG: helix-turn-helix transcriptional regulator [Desulfosarcina sp.]|jgi:transcriptional regulator with XRE-family HTH domain
MRKFEDTLASIIESSGLKLNQISKVSGISNAYLTKLIKGHINKPGKDKIASILLALNYSLTDINSILADYDYMPLNRHDIPEILNNNRRRKFEGRILPQFDHIYFELLMAALENLGGTKILVKHRPSGIFLPSDLYMMKEFPTESDREADRFFRTFTREVVAERKALFLENCARGHRYETYMCRECLEDSLRRNIGPDAQQSDLRKVDLYAKFYANAVSATLKAPGQHFYRVVNRCPYFQFQIQDADGDTPKVSYTAMRRHNFENAIDQFTLESFLSDDAGILTLFKNEVSHCQGALVRSRGCHTPEGFHAFIRERFDVFGVAAQFDAALATLMASPGFHFH